MRKSLPLPGGLLQGESHLSLLGNRELTVEGCRGILEYETDGIRLNLGTARLTVQGNGLTLLALEHNYAQIGGEITSVVFD